MYQLLTPSLEKKKKSYFRGFPHFFVLDKTLGNTSHKQHHTVFALVQLLANQEHFIQVNTTRFIP